mmetsp:Transcript_74914/g.200961  ORF Transcript_74914/g.200961 Transcript_74914/m.200961 type:complete len:223 (-) Transcript_74914:5987-6655(-)
MLNGERGETLTHRRLHWQRCGIVSLGTEFANLLVVESLLRVRCRMNFQCHHVQIRRRWIPPIHILSAPSSKAAVLTSTQQLPSIKTSLAFRAVRFLVKIASRNCSRGRIPFRLSDPLLKQTFRWSQPYHNQHFHVHLQPLKSRIGLRLFVCSMIRRLPLSRMGASLGVIHLVCLRSQVMFLLILCPSQQRFRFLHRKGISLIQYLRFQPLARETANMIWMQR